MALYHTTDHQGVSEINPSANKMRSLLDSLDSVSTQETEHQDVSLVHDPSGWSLNVYPSNIVTFENLDKPNNTPYFMTSISRKDALKLWLRLSRGEIDHIKSQPWLQQDV